MQRLIIKIWALLLVLVICCTTARHHYKSKDNQKPKYKSKAKETYDQQQTGEYNVRLNLKDFQVIALLGDDSFGDYDYSYDYSELTIKPVNPVFTKPTSPSPSSTSEVSETTESLSTTKKPSEDLIILADEIMLNKPSDIKDKDKDTDTDSNKDQLVLPSQKVSLRNNAVNTMSKRDRPSSFLVETPESEPVAESIKEDDKVKFIEIKDAQEQHLTVKSPEISENADRVKISAEKKKDDGKSDEKVEPPKPNPIVPTIMDSSVNSNSANKDKIVSLTELLLKAQNEQSAQKVTLPSVPSEIGAVNSNDGLKLATEFDSKKPYFSLLETLRMRRCSSGFMRDRFGNCRRLTRRRKVPTAVPVGLQLRKMIEM